jgi:acylphosphatase
VNVPTRSEKALRVVVSGRVQGVFFRGATREQGERLGLTGWVRNLADGSVEAHIQGPAALVDAMLDWCRHGPPSARVDHLVSEVATVEPSLQRFSIRP